MVLDLICTEVLLSDGSKFDKNAIKFGAGMSSSVYISNRKADVLILGKDPVQVLDDTTLTAEKEYAINFSEQKKKFCLSLYCNSANSYLFVNGAEIYKFKAKNLK